MATPRRPNRPPTRDRILISLRSGCSLRAVESYYDGASQRESTRLAIGRALQSLGMVIPESQRNPRTERDLKFLVSSSGAPKGAP